MKKILKRVVLVLAVLFVIAQVIRPARTNPSFDESKTMQATTQVPPEVSAIFERSCKDCHSSRTDWPWYSNVTPVNWFLTNHVNDGRGQFSFSEWGTYPARKASRKLDEICEQVELGEMPLKSYQWLHPSSKLSEADKKTLCAWTNQERARLAASQPTPAPQ